MIYFFTVLSFIFCSAFAQEQILPQNEMQKENVVEKPQFSMQIPQGWHFQADFWDDDDEITLTEDNYDRECFSLLYEFGRQKEYLMAKKIMEFSMNELKEGGDLFAFSQSKDENTEIIIATFFPADGAQMVFAIKFFDDKNKYIIFGYEKEGTINDEDMLEMKEIINGTRIRH